MHGYSPPLHNERAKRFFLMLSIAIEGAKNCVCMLSITIGRLEYILLLEKFRHEDAIANLSKAGK